MKKELTAKKTATRNTKAIEAGLLKLFNGLPLSVKASEFSPKELNSLKNSKAGYRQIMMAACRIASRIEESRLVEGMDF